MAVKYKHRCMKCKKNYVTITWRQGYVICYDCQKEQMKGVIKDPKMKRLLNIPEKLYKKNSFLRNIKVNYLRYGNLTDKQIAAFKKVVKKVKEEENS